MLTQIDVVYDASIQDWSYDVNYKIGRRVTYDGKTWEALAESNDAAPSISNPVWELLGDTGQIDVPVVEEAALALPIMGLSTKDSLLLRKVTGLNPPDVDLFIGEYSRDGGSHQGRRVRERNVVLTIDLNPNPALGETEAGLREILYRIFLDPLDEGQHVELVLRSDDGLVRNLYGYTEKFETALFEQDNMVQISLICPDPYIRDVFETVMTNTLGTWTTLPIEYNGSAETGIKTQIEINQRTSVLNLYSNGRIMRIEHSFLEGDVVNINTTRGEREINLVRNNQVTPLLAKLSDTSKWIGLKTKNNVLSVFGLNKNQGIGGIRTISFRSSYWGV